jgi:hypothetical protein
MIQVHMLVCENSCCTECLASLRSTVFMYASVTIAALDIQSASKASIAITLYMPEGRMKLIKKKNKKRNLFCFTTKVPQIEVLLICRGICIYNKGVSHTFIRGGTFQITNYPL